MGLAEMIDIVNRDDEVIGVKPRDEVWEDEITRSSACFVIDKEGNILIAQRDVSKKYNPGIWSIAVAETVQAWEDYLTAIIRGAYEEIQLSAISDDFVAREKIFYPRNNIFRQTYFMICTEEQKKQLVPKEGEVQAIQWVPVLDLKKMIEEMPALFSRSLPEILPYREKYKQAIITALEERKAPQ